MCGELTDIHDSETDLAHKEEDEVQLDRTQAEYASVDGFFWVLNWKKEKELQRSENCVTGTDQVRLKRFGYFEHDNADWVNPHIIVVITRPHNCIWKMLKKCPKKCLIIQLFTNILDTVLLNYCYYY